MTPGEIITKSAEVEINNHHPETVIEVKNTGDQPIQVGSHFYFYEANAALDFEREMTCGKRLDIPAGAAIRFEPEDKKGVQLVEYASKHKIFDFHGMVNGPIDGSRVCRPADENDEYVDVFGDNGTENVNKKGGKRS